VCWRRNDRPGLKLCLEFLRPGDVLVVWKLDRLGRSLSHPIGIVGGLHARGVGFRSLLESIDTTTAMGKFLFHVFGTSSIDRLPWNLASQSTIVETSLALSQDSTLTPCQRDAIIAGERGAAGLASTGALRLFKKLTSAT
jgi:hypothetical protein